MEEEKLVKHLTMLGCKAIKGKFGTAVCHGDEGEYKFDTVTNVNFKPHPFTIGSQLVAHASDNWSGMLGKEAIEDYENIHGSACAYRDENGRCRIPYAEHTSDRVAFLKVKSDKELKDNKELPKFLFACKPTFEKEKIDGVGFVKWE